MRNERKPDTKKVNLAWINNTINNKLVDVLILNEMLHDKAKKLKKVT
jgi:hypothetical protein